MNVVGTILSVAIIAAVLAYVLHPLVVGPSGERQRRAHRSTLARQMDGRARLLEARNTIYAEIRELDFDHETGKVSDEDHTRQRAELMRAGVEVLMQLDHLEAEAPAEDALEDAIATMRRHKVDLATRNDTEPGTSRFQEETAANSNLTCPVCDTPYRPGDTFCSHCGAALHL